MMTRLAVALCVLMPWLAFGANIDFRSVNTNHFTTNGYRVSLRSIQTNETIAVAVTNIVTSLVGTGSVTLVQVTNAIGSAMTTSNMVYVDKAGNDTTGLINRMDRRFLNVSNGAAVVASSTTLDLGPGTYNITPALVLGSVICSNMPLSGSILWTNKANVLVRGNGRAVLQATTNGTIFFIKDCTNIVFDGVTFRGIYPNTNFTILHGAVQTSSSDVKFFNCRFENLENHCISPISGDCERGNTILVDGCTFINYGNTNINGGIDGAGVHPTLSRNLRVVNSYFENGTMGVEVEGYREPTLTNQQNVQIEGNTFKNMYGYPIVVFGNTIGSVSNRAYFKISKNFIDWDAGYTHPQRPGIFIAQVYDALIEGNTIRNANYGGIRIESTGFPTRWITLKDNFIDSPAEAGIGVYFTEGYMEGVNIVHNTIVHGQKTGIEYQGSSATIRDNRVFNCNMESGGHAGIWMRDFVAGLWSNNVVERNFIGNIDGITNMAVGLKIDAAFDNTRISGQIYADGITTKEINNGVGTTIFSQESGRTGIGTNTPSFHLEVSGDVKITGTNLSLHNTLNSGEQSKLRIAVEGLASTNYMQPDGFGSYGASTLLKNYSVPLSSYVHWAITSDGSLIPGLNVGYDLGNSSFAVRTNYSHWVRTTNISILGGSPGIGKVLTSDANGVGTWGAAGAGSQTPWLSDINGGGFNLTNVGSITATNNITAATYTGVGVINQPSVLTLLGTNLTNFSFLMSSPGHLPTNIGLIMPTNSTASSNAIMLALATSSNTFQLYPFANGPSGYVLKPTNVYPYVVWAPDDTGGAGGAAADAFTAKRQNIVRWEEFMSSSYGALDYGEMNLQRTATGTGSGIIADISPTNAVGVAQLSTGTATNGLAGFQTSAAAVSFGGGNWTNEIRFKVTTLPTADEGYTLRLGFMDSAGSDATDGAYLRFDTNDTHFVLVTRTNSVESSITNTTVVAAGTWYKARIVVIGIDSATLTIDDGDSVQLTTNIPAGSTRATGLGIWLTKTSGTTARSASVDYMGMAVGFTNSR